jgi:hypothetical protein
MAKRRRGLAIGKSPAAAVLAVLAYVGLQYTVMLRDMDRAAGLYSEGDLEAALKTYEGVEQRLRAHGALRLIPATDRRTLLLNQARLLYAMNEYDEAASRLTKEEEISGVAGDGRFLYLRGNITYRRARLLYDQTPKVDLNTLNVALNLLQDGLVASEENFRESLQLAPNNWDAKYNLEFLHFMRRAMGTSPQEDVKFLEKEQAPQPPALPPQSVG